MGRTDRIDRTVGVQKRIYGLETEYGIIFTPEGRKTLPVEKAIRFLFEKLINVVHEHAPKSRICFNTTPGDTASAVQRCIPIEGRT